MTILYEQVEHPTIRDEMFVAVDVLSSSEFEQVSKIIKEKQASKECRFEYKGGHKNKPLCWFGKTKKTLSL